MDRGDTSWYTPNGSNYLCSTLGTGYQLVLGSPGSTLPGHVDEAVLESVEVLSQESPGNVLDSATLGECQLGPATS